MPERSDLNLHLEKELAFLIELEKILKDKALILSALGTAETLVTTNANNPKLRDKFIFSEENFLKAFDETPDKLANGITLSNPRITPEIFKAEYGYDNPNLSLRERIMLQGALMEAMTVLQAADIEKQEGYFIQNENTSEQQNIAISERKGFFIKKIIQSLNLQKVDTGFQSLTQLTASEELLTHIAQAKQQYQDAIKYGKKTVLILDVDETSVSSEGKLNPALFAAAKAAGLQEIYFLTDSSARTLSSEADQHYNRMRLKKAAEAVGLTVRGFVTTSDPGYRKGLGQTFEDYSSNYYGEDGSKLQTNMQRFNQLKVIYNNNDYFIPATQRTTRDQDKEKIVALKSLAQHLSEEKKSLAIPNLDKYFRLEKISDSEFKKKDFLEFLNFQIMALETDLYKGMTNDLKHLGLEGGDDTLKRPTFTYLLEHLPSDIGAIIFFDDKPEALRDAGRALALYNKDKDMPIVMTTIQVMGKDFDEKKVRETKAKYGAVFAEHSKKLDPTMQRRLRGNRSLLQRKQKKHAATSIHTETRKESSAEMLVIQKMQQTYTQLNRTTHQKEFATLVKDMESISNNPHKSVTRLELEFKNQESKFKRPLMKMFRGSFPKNLIDKLNSSNEDYQYPRMLALLLQAAYAEDPTLLKNNKLGKQINQIRLPNHPAFLDMIPSILSPEKYLQYVEFKHSLRLNLPEHQVYNLFMRSLTLNSKDPNLINNVETLWPALKRYQLSLSQIQDLVSGKPVIVDPNRLEQLRNQAELNYLMKEISGKTDRINSADRKNKLYKKLDLPYDPETATSKLKEIQQAMIAIQKALGQPIATERASTRPASLKGG